MFEAHHHAVLEFLRDRELVTPDQFEEAAADSTGRSLSDIVLDHGWVERAAFLAEVAEHLGYDYVAEPPSSLPGEAVGDFPGNLARTYGVVPLRSDSTTVELLAIDPFNTRVTEDLTFALGRDVRMNVADPDRVSDLLKRHYGDDDASLEELLADIQQVGEEVETDNLSEAELEAFAEQAPIVRFVNLVLSQAVNDGASDIHFEPFEVDYKIRYRVDGALYEMAPPPKHMALPIASRLKVLANLNIAERRVPQDGRIKITLSGRPVDVRVSTLPTQFGESVVLRVLDQGAVQLDLAQIGLPAAVEAGVRKIIHRPNGILVVTGPTGSGKTTTLYSALRELNESDRKLLTAEDPVEYEIEGVMQVPINPSIGLTFDRALRTFLRQDPDVIMVGEIRDFETAQIAIQASLTGHLVLATLHTNDATGAVTRLIDMGLEPFLISSSLEAVLAQRLVRKICVDCRKPYALEPEMLSQLGVTESFECFRGQGCSTCSGTGYHGRHGLFEWLPLSEPMREKISNCESTMVMKRQAAAEGVGSLRDAGIEALRSGITTVDEVLQYT
ncbi:MAG: ATPase, T2SS/T4P/T4SS family [Opitutaceae bacterium]|tara:strand:+ start:1398 stop:3071 length:1674 start_codon:yes stop_codon:yes gene_type:complete